RGHGQKAGGLAAGAVEMLVPGVERNGEQAARGPLERLLLLPLVPYGGAATAGKDVGELFIQVPLRSELFPRRNFAHVGGVELAGTVELDLHGVAAGASPVFQGHGVDVVHLPAAEEVQALARYPLIEEEAVPLSLRHRADDTKSVPTGVRRLRSAGQHRLQEVQDLCLDLGRGLGGAVLVM